MSGPCCAYGACIRESAPGEIYCGAAHAARAVADRAKDDGPDVEKRPLISREVEHAAPAHDLPRLPTPEEHAALMMPMPFGAVRAVRNAITRDRLALEGATGARDAAILARLDAAQAKVDPVGDAVAELNALCARLATLRAELRGGGP